MRTDLAIILTARVGSTRLPAKALADVNDKPLLYWIMRRLSAIGNVVLATTTNREDGVLLALAEAAGVPCYRGPVDDVITRMDNALNLHYPRAKYVLRGLGDCPFMAGELIERACQVMHLQRAEAFAWALPPTTWPVYGAREFPYTRTAWERIVKNSTSREHVDEYYHNHRAEFATVYHEPPKNVYFRPYRLEVDWPEDLAVIRGIAANLSMLTPLTGIIKYLDSADAVAKLNHSRVEQTGPTCYTYEVQRSWFRNLEGQPIVGWDGQLWRAPNGKGQPVFCKAGQCLLGVAENKILFSKVARIKGDAYLNCQCGAGLHWVG